MRCNQGGRHLAGACSTGRCRAKKVFQHPKIPMFDHVRQFVHAVPPESRQEAVNVACSSPSKRTQPATREGAGWFSLLRTSAHRTVPCRSHALLHLRGTSTRASRNEYGNDPAKAMEHLRHFMISSTGRRTRRVFFPGAVSLP